LEEHIRQIVRFPSKPQEPSTLVEAVVWLSARTGKREGFSPSLLRDVGLAFLMVL
jgi:hypothetical protein